MRTLLVVFAYLAFALKSCSAGYPLNQTCSAPVSEGGKGYCGPSFCDNVQNSKPGCIFTNAPVNYQDRVANTKQYTCTQPTDPRCTSAALKALMVGQGIKAAFCNDAFLVIITDGTGGFATTLSSVKNPPASVDSTNVACVTRYVNPSFFTVQIPLFPKLLNTSDPSINNVNNKSFPAGGADADGGYLSTAGGSGATYGLPTRGRVT